MQRRAAFLVLLAWASDRSPPPPFLKGVKWVPSGNVAFRIGNAVGPKRVMFDLSEVKRNFTKWYLLDASDPTPSAPTGKT